MEASSHMTWECYSYCGKSVVEHLQQVQDYLWSHSYLEICFLVISQQRLEGWGIWYNFHFNHQLTDVLVVIIVSPLRYCNNVYISYIHIYGTLYILGPIHTNLFSKRFASALIVFACPHYNADQERSHIVALSTILDTHGRVVWHPSVSILMTSLFSESMVFSIHTRKLRFQKASFSNHSTLESVSKWLHFRWSFSAL